MDTYCPLLKYDKKNTVIRYITVQNELLIRLLATRATSDRIYSTLASLPEGRQRKEKREKREASTSCEVTPFFFFARAKKMHVLVSQKKTMKHEAMNLVQNTTTGAEANTKRTIDEMAATAVVCHSTDETMSRDNGPAAPMHHDDVHQPVLGGMKPTVEPLKVCLDDDSSIEDGDEDMFDDDAFYFGDEDFEALMSHESMKRPRPGLSRINNAPASAALADENLQSPLQHSASMFNDIGGVAASSSSTAASSYGEFSYGRGCHGLFHQHIKNY